MKYIKQIAAWAFVIIGIILTYDGYKTSRPTYYLTHGGSHDDYAVAGYMILIVGIIILTVALLYLYFSNKNKSSNQ